MLWHAYRECDSAFGQTMLKLRTSIGLTQAGLAGRLRVSEFAAQCANARYSWTERTAADPSPTAAATRLIEPARTSPTANNPG